MEGRTTDEYILHAWVSSRGRMKQQFIQDFLELCYLDEDLKKNPKFHIEMPTEGLYSVRFFELALADELEGVCYYTNSELILFIGLLVEEIKDISALEATVELL